jgi:hypothetical protein
MIKTFNNAKEVISLKQGNYNIIVEKEEVTLIRDSESEKLNEILNNNWEYLGDPDYATLGSDFPFVIVQDKKSNFPELNEEWIEDNITNFYANENYFIFEIPCGSGGGLSVFTLKDENGSIIGVKLNGLHAEDM